MLKNAQPVLDIAHDLPVALLILLKELRILLHLVVHLAGKSRDLILERGIKIMKFLLELKERLEVLVICRRSSGDPLEDQKGRGKSAERNGNSGQDQERSVHARIINLYRFSVIRSTCNAQRKSCTLNVAR